MYVTKNDLSFNKMELDYEAMLHTAKTAFAHSIEEISRYTQQLREDYDKEYGVGLVLNAGWLQKEARHLTIVSETLSALLGGRTREQIEIINKELVKKED